MLILRTRRKQQYNNVTIRDVWLNPIQTLVPIYSCIYFIVDCWTCLCNLAHVERHGHEQHAAPHSTDCPGQVDCPQLLGWVEYHPCRNAYK